jgi:palmitoyltransferase
MAVQVEPSGLELLFIVLNYATCVPVILTVGAFRFVPISFLLLIITCIFSLYHFYCLTSNSTTIEGWEKDKVATLVRRGQIQEVSSIISGILLAIFDWYCRSNFHMYVHISWDRRDLIESLQNLGLKRNITAALGKNPLLWCCPTTPPGDGLTYELADGNGDSFC